MYLGASKLKPDLKKAQLLDQTLPTFLSKLVTRDGFLSIRTFLCKVEKSCMQREDAERCNNIACKMDYGVRQGDETTQRLARPSKLDLAADILNQHKDALFSYWYDRLEWPLCLLEHKR